MVSVRVDIRPAEAKLKKLMKIRRPEFWRDLIGQRYIAWFDENFRKEGVEVKWDPLAESTIYARKRGGKRVLQDIGRLKQSFQDYDMRGRGKTEGEVGTNSQIAPYHHFGTRRRQIVPRRKKFLTIPSANGPAKFTKGALAGKRGYFSKGVTHPGLPKRPLLPSKRLAKELGIRVSRATLERLTRGRV